MQPKTMIPAKNVKAEMDKLHAITGLHLPTKAMIAAFSIRSDLKERLDALATKYPDPLNPKINAVESLRAIAPQEILDHLGITDTLSPPPVIVIKRHGRENVRGEYDNLQICATDLEGLDHLTVTPISYKVDDSNCLVYDSRGNKVIAGLWFSIMVKSSPSSRMLFWGGNCGIPHCWLEINIEATNLAGETATYSFTYESLAPAQPSTPPTAPTTEYSDEAAAFARQHNLNPVSVQKLYNGCDALNEGNWSATWYGSIEVELSPDECEKIQILTEVILGSEIAISIILATQAALNWQTVLILAGIMIQVSEIHFVMTECVKDNKPGKIGFNIPTGLFYAYN